MPIGSSQRDRRRRVLLDDTQEGIDSKNTKTSSKSSTDKGNFERPYTDEALVDNHPPVTWLVPRKFWVIVFIGLVLLGILVGLNLLNANVDSWGEKYGATKVIAFDMTAGRSLVRWLTSFLLIVGASNCINIYVIRRHRSDDYRGTYRIWVWLAAIIILISINSVANFDTFAYMVSEDLAREHLGLQNRVYFLLLTLVPAALVILRVLIEIRSSFSSVAAFGLAVSAFLFALLIRIESVVLPEHIDTRIMHCNAMLVGYISMYLSTVSYSRFVFLDSQGALAEKWKSKSERVAAKQLRREQRELERSKAKEERELRRAEKAEQKAKLSDEKQAAKEKSVHERQSAKQQKESERKTSKKGKREAESNDLKEDSAQRAKNKLLGNRKSTSKNKSQSSRSEKNEHNSRLIPDFQEVAGDEYDIEDLQQQLAETNSRSERKRLKKLIQRLQNQERRAA